MRATLLIMFLQSIRLKHESVLVGEYSFTMSVLLMIPNMAMKMKMAKTIK